MDGQTVTVLFLTLLTTIFLFFGAVKLVAAFWRTFNKTAKVILFFGVVYLVFGM